MIIQNNEEYKLVRQEMASLKDCMTIYIGYVFGGSGLVFIGLALLPKDIRNMDILPLLFFVLAFVINLMLMVLIYKFNSHNRFAGYCKLLNQEKISLPVDKKTVNSIETIQFSSWEICVDRLRESDFIDTNLFEESFYGELCKNVDIKFLPQKGYLESMKEFIGNNPNRDKKRIRKGFLILLKGLFSIISTRSWKFPIHVVLIFFSLNVVFFIFGFKFLFANNFLEDGFVKIFSISNILNVFFLVANFILWIFYLGKLHKIINGSATVDAYCWKFLALRYNFFKEQNEQIKYSITTLKNKSELLNFV